MHDGAHVGAVVRALLLCQACGSRAHPGPGIGAHLGRSLLAAAKFHAEAGLEGLKQQSLTVGLQINVPARKTRMWRTT